MVVTVPGLPGLSARHLATVARNSVPGLITVASPTMFRLLLVARLEVTPLGPLGQPVQLVTTSESHQLWLRGRVVTVVRPSKKFKKRPVSQLVVRTGLSGVDGEPVRQLVEVVSVFESVPVSDRMISAICFSVIVKKLRLVMAVSELTWLRVGPPARLLVALEFKLGPFQTHVPTTSDSKARRVLPQQVTTVVGLHGQRVPPLAEAAYSKDDVTIAAEKHPMFR